MKVSDVLKKFSEIGQNPDLRKTIFTGLWEVLTPCSKLELLNFQLTWDVNKLEDEDKNG